MASLLFFSRRYRCTLSSLLSCCLALSCRLIQFWSAVGKLSWNWVLEGFLYVCVCWRGRGGRGLVYLKCLPKEVKSRTILPLGSLHADPVCWHPGSSYAAMGGAHQSDCNPTLDVSTCLRVGLLPLGGQATGYRF